MDRKTAVAEANKMVEKMATRLGMETTWPAFDKSVSLVVKANGLVTEARASAQADGVDQFRPVIHVVRHRNMGPGERFLFVSSDTYRSIAAAATKLTSK